MYPEAAAWAIFLLPLFSFAVITFIIRPFFNQRAELSGYLAIATIGGSLALSVWALLSVIATPHHEIAIAPVEWVVIGDTTIRLSLIMDPLTAIMLVVASSVSLFIQIYSQGYMHGDPGYSRYYAFMLLFTASMLGLVLAANLVMLYVFWELVGLCSYLLIGFWFHRPSAAAAAKKAFIVTRLGDFGFLIAILIIFTQVHTFDIPALLSDEKLLLLSKGVLLGLPVLTWAALGIFSGAAGKSAQFPLHVWLPDAMEGPTPVSALIHAATMVAAGVYLVARLLPLFAHSPQAIATVTLIGAFTAIFAASMGLVMNDIKRVLAYSTISQLGYMMLGLGAGSVAVGIFHLFNHAFFKALLFLGAGSVNHATGTFDMRQMGGLRKFMPWTFATFLIAALSIAGIWPLSGFWSKDEIMAQVWEHHSVLFLVAFAMALVTVFMTAFYMFRALFMTFGGEYRGGAAHAHTSPAHPNPNHTSHAAHGPALHESPAVMVVPMVLLAIMSVVSGWANLSGAFTELFGEHAEAPGLFTPLLHPLPLVSLVTAILGILLAYAMYSARWISPERVGALFHPLYTMLSRKYWFDDLYERAIVGKFLVNGLFALANLFDIYVVDGLVNGVASVTTGAGSVIRRLQTGQVQGYALAICLGILVIMAFIYMSS